MKEKILEAFSNLGFKLEDADEFGYAFSYEGLNMLYLYNETEEEFLNIALPGICDCVDDNALQICALLEKLNSALKYIKAYLVGDRVWLFYEREILSEDEDFMMIISHMINHLDGGLVYARQAMAEIENMVDDDSSEEDGEECDAEEIETNGTSDKDDDDK